MLSERRKLRPEGQKVSPDDTLKAVAERSATQTSVRSTAVPPGRRRDAKSILDLFWRYEHDSPISPLCDRITRALVIADRLFYSTTCCLDYPILEIFVGGRLRLQLSF